MSNVNTDKVVEGEKAFRHGWADNSNRFQQDRWIRSCGFKIHSRLKGHEPMWEKDGDLYTQSEVLELVKEK